MKPDINIMAPDQHRICAFCKPEREMGENYISYYYLLLCNKKEGHIYMIPLSAECLYNVFARSDLETVNRRNQMEGN
jgi:hypothetical protein